MRRRRSFPVGWLAVAGVVAVVALFNVGAVGRDAGAALFGVLLCLAAIVGIFRLALWLRLGFAGIVLAGLLMGFFGIALGIMAEAGVNHAITGEPVTAATGCARGDMGCKWDAVERNFDDAGAVWAANPDQVQGVIRDSLIGLVVVVVGAWFIGGRLK